MVADRPSGFTCGHGARARQIVSRRGFLPPALWVRLALDEDAGEVDLQERVGTEIKVGGESEKRKKDPRQTVVPDGQQGAGAKADDGGGYESEERGDRAKASGAVGVSHGRNVLSCAQGSPEKDLKKF